MKGDRRCSRALALRTRRLLGECWWTGGLPQLWGHPSALLLLRPTSSGSSSSCLQQQMKEPNGWVSGGGPRCSWERHGALAINPLCTFIHLWPPSCQMTLSSPLPEAFNIPKHQLERNRVSVTAKAGGGRGGRGDGGDGGPSHV